MTSPDPMRSPHRLVSVEGDAFTIGRQYGEQARDLIQHAARTVFPGFLSDKSGSTPDELADRARSYEPFIEQHAPLLHQELRGLQQGAQLEWHEVLILQARPELAGKAKAPQECSALATVTRSRDGQPIVAQNVDMDPQLQELGVMLDIRRDGSPRILTWTLAGVLGQTGINGAGLARCGNVLFADGWRDGVPTSILFRLTLEQQTIDDVVQLCAEVPRAKSNNFLVADASGRVVDIEMTVTEQAVVSSNDTLVHTNHYCDASMLPHEASPRLANSTARLERLTELVKRPTIDADACKEILSDHANEADSICAHGGSGSRTIASCILEPAQGRMHVAFGPPCENDYEVFEL